MVVSEMVSSRAWIRIIPILSASWSKSLGFCVVTAIFVILSNAISVFFPSLLSCSCIFVFQVLVGVGERRQGQEGGHFPCHG